MAQRIRMAILYLTLPLGFLFFVLDVLLENHPLAVILASRSLIIPFWALGFSLWRKQKEPKHTLILLYAIVSYFSITNSFLISTSGSFFLGLATILTTVIYLGLIPLGLRNFSFLAMILYAPYISIAGLRHGEGNIAPILVTVMIALATLGATWLGISAWTKTQKETHDSLTKEIAIKNNLQKIITSKQEEAIINFTIGDNFPHDIADEIRKNPDLIKTLKRRTTCQLFYDIKESTKKSQIVDPYDFQATVDDLILKSNNIFKSYGCIIGQYLGDGNLIFSNAPIDREGFNFFPILAAVDVLTHVKNISKSVESKIGFSLELRIGLNLGYTFCKCAPQFGSGLYTVTGREVNLASRICARAEVGTILISKKHLSSLSVKQINELKDKANIRFLGDEKNIKSFEGQSIGLVEITPRFDVVESHKDRCSNCQIGIYMVVEKIENGTIVKCSHCNFTDIIS